MIRREPIAWCGPSPCPRCGVVSPCVDHGEVDIGVGTQTFDHEYCCPAHGGFSFSHWDGQVLWRDSPEEEPAATRVAVAGADP